jgi:hypothetical protein
MTGDRGDIERLREIAQLVTRLRAENWSVTDGLAGAVLESPTLDSHQPLLDVLNLLHGLVIDARITGSRPGGQCVLHYREGELSVARRPDGTPRSMFDELAEQEIAERLWAGEARAAFELTWAWSARAEVSLGDLVTSPPSHVDVRVAIFSTTICETIASTPFWRLGELLSAPGDRRVFLALDGPATATHLGSLTLAGPDLKIADVPPAIDWQTNPELISELPQLPRPSALTRLDPGSQVDAAWEELVTVLRATAGAAAWCELATDVRIKDQGVQLTFRGFRRITLTLTPPADPEGVLSLHGWATAESSPDRLLAIQQVASLQEANQLLDQAGDLRGSAEIVYSGLRTQAVAEAVRGYREANAAALDTVRQTLKSVQELTKNATDRGFAALVAVGAVLIANGTRSLSTTVGRDLLLLVAAFLIFLAIWSLLIEGPLVAAPLDSLKADLRRAAPLVTEAQIDELLTASAISNVRRRANLVRVLIPCFHLLLGLAIIFFGFPSRYR